ncbi:MAG: tryptophan 2,3-dioxygenase family protein [Nitrososphaerales archaeon]
MQKGFQEKPPALCPFHQNHNQLPREAYGINFQIAKKRNFSEDQSENNPTNQRISYYKYIRTDLLFQIASSDVDKQVQLAYHLLQDFVQIASRSKIEVNPEHLAEVMDKLQTIKSIFGLQNAIFNEHDSSDSRLGQTLRPISNLPEERLFIRILQLHEVIIELTLKILAPLIGRDFDQEKVQEWSQTFSNAAKCLATLTSAMNLFSAISPESFNLIRELTKGSSAIQSKRYHELFLICDRRKDSVWSKLVRHYGSMEKFYFSAKINSDAHDLLISLEEYNTKIFDWKRLHLKFAENYIGSKKGTGGTSGVSYLNRTLGILPFSQLEFVRGG